MQNRGRKNKDTITQTARYGCGCLHKIVGAPADVYREAQQAWRSACPVCCPHGRPYVSAVQSDKGLIITFQTIKAPVQQVQLF